VKVLFRTDASAATGTGHAMRCLALAQAIGDAGGTSLFIGDLGAAASRRLRSEGFELRAVGAPGGTRDDARVTAELAGAEAVDWIVVDGYHLGSSYRRHLSGRAWRLMAIDDQAADLAAADAWVNGNLFASPPMYDEADAEADVLAGPRYALLRREFWRTTRPMVRRARARRVLVTFGGSDPAEMTPVAIAALAGVSPPPEVRVLVGGDDGAGRPGSLARRTGFSVDVDVVDMTEPLAWADLVVGAAGTSALEYAWARLPSIVVSVADNQRPVAAAVDRLGIGLDATTPAGAGPEALGAVIGALLKDDQRLVEMGEASDALVDGSGAKRVAGLLGGESLALRPVTPVDEEVLLTWANDPVARAASFQSGTIAPAEHAAWFADRLADPNARLYVGEQDGRPVGLVRFAVADETATISVNVGPTSRMRGVGTRLIDHGCRRLLRERGVTAFHAYIRAGNEASVRAFTAAGFARADRGAQDGMPGDALLMVRAAGGRG